MSDTLVGGCAQQARYKGVMVAVTPCRSDMSAAGLAPGAHLADGRAQLLLVRDVPRLSFLRFLASIPGGGARCELFVGWFLRVWAHGAGLRAYLGSLSRVRGAHAPVSLSCPCFLALSIAISSPRILREYACQPRVASPI